MRAFLLSTVVAVGLGLAIAAPASAAPANGAVIGEAAEMTKAVDQVRWWRRYHWRWHHWRWHRYHHYHHRWW
jgi:hypothetical protein